MSSVSKLGIGLGVVIVCFLLVIMAELYYVFCWKKRFSSNSSSSSTQHMMNNRQIEEGEVENSREVFYFFCWRKHLQQGAMKSTTVLNATVPSQADDRRIMNGGHHQDEGEEVLSPESPDEDFISRLFPLRREGLMESRDVMTIEGLLGPPRFLFTIKEETREDMESEDGKSTRGGKSHKGSHGRSLSDPFAHMRIVDFAAESPPFLTPPSSPPFYTPLETPPRTPLHHSSSQSPSTSPSTGCLDFSKDLKLCDEAGTFTPLMEMCDGSLSSSPHCNSGDENASFITIFVKR